MRSDTGERLHFDAPARFREEHLNRLMHLATYEFALDFTRGVRVLDLGSGTGYGAARIATVAEAVTGADVCAESVDEARARFSRSNLDFQRIEPHGALPFSADAFDVVLSFQVVEHLVDPHAHLREIRRVLKPGGTLLLATPNRGVRLFSFQRPWNRWHPTEYDAAGLRALVSAHFQRVELQTMTADEALVRPELRRYARLRWLTLPVTLPLWPDAFRVLGLTLLRSLLRLRRAPSKPPVFKGDTSAVRIGLGASPALNLVVIASD